MPVDQAQLAAMLKTAGKKKGGKGKKGRKIGRSKKHPAAQRYLYDRRWIENKAKRMRRHLKRYPDDKQAQGLLNTYLDNHREIK